MSQLGRRAVPRSGVRQARLSRTRNTLLIAGTLLATFFTVAGAATYGFSSAPVAPPASDISASGIGASDTGESSTSAPSTTAPSNTAPSTTAPSNSTREQDTDGVIAGAGANTALAALAVLDVKGRAPKTGYNRDLFGQAWSDVDRNGCDTRNDILARDLVDQVFKANTNNCVVASGLLDNPYTGTVISFVRGQDTSEAVQIDHVVALSDAWQTGAQSWDVLKRTAFANDPLNLLAVDGPSNMAKSDSDAASWLPPNKAYRCEFVARQVAVKVRYEAWVTTAERSAIASILSSCPTQQLPVDETVGTATKTSTATSPAASSAPVPVAASSAHETGCEIKGNIAGDGEKIYHVPSGASYEETKISETNGERWFCSPADAEAAGWRASQR